MGEKGVSENSHLKPAKLLIWPASFSFFSQQTLFFFRKIKLTVMNSCNLRTCMCSTALKLVWMCLGVEWLLCWECGRSQLEIMNPFLRTCMALAESGQKAVSSQMKRNLLSLSCGKNILPVTTQDEMLATQHLRGSNSSGLSSNSY